MAALLRSARLLKFSPSGLFQITGTNRNGPPLGRLYSGALGSSRTRINARYINQAAEKASSHAWPCAVGCARRYTTATEQKDDTSLALRAKQAREFEWALTRLDGSVRRTGRITKTMLLRVFHSICRTGYPSSNQALLLLRSCGTLLPEVPPAERTELAHHMWEKLQELGAQFDVSHYNALLKVYLQNEFKFSPSDFLAKMDTANIAPNRVTYQRLIAAYCANGDIAGASTILGIMKTKDLPISESVFNSLVTGHARSGDIESAKNILIVMQEAGIEPGPDTFVSLLNAHAEKGDLDSLKQTLEAVESADCSLMDRDLMDVIFTLAKAGHPQHIPVLVERLRQERGYVPDAMNLCLSLITHGLQDTSFHILKTFSNPLAKNLDNDTPNLGHFFLRHCVSMETPLDKVASYCKELQESKLHDSPLAFTLSCALEMKKSAMSFALMKIMKEQDLPVRPHYFWPLFTQHLKDDSKAGVFEVLKGMQELEIAPDTETLSNYIVPVFHTIEAARDALKEAGLSLQSVGALPSEVRLMAQNNLADLYALLSDPSFKPLSLGIFRSSLITGFKKSDDVESMVKLTELLYKDTRFCQESSNPPEKVHYLLYNLFDNMTETEVQEQEEKLRKYFNQLQAKNIKIPANIFKGIVNLVNSYNVPELIKDVNALVPDSDLAKINGSQETGISFMGFEKRIDVLKAENKPYSSVLKQLISALCSEEKLERALELKQQNEEAMTAATYAILISCCCRHNNVEEALNLKREMTRMDSSVTLDASKYLTLVKALATNGMMEEAVDILKEMKEKSLVLNDLHLSLLQYTLNGVAANGDVDTVQRLQDTAFTLGLVNPSRTLCSPLVSAYLKRDDLTGALDASIECMKRYRHMPRSHEIIVGLVEKGDTEQLQKAMDLVREHLGEMTMLYDLFFAFLQTGRYREARKIIETPGLRAKAGRLYWFAEKCISNKQLETLEQMVDMTAKLFECDRDEMYHYFLRACNETNDWKKAEAAWTKMQEENLIPREKTLRLMANILKNNGQEVPFEVPETWYEQGKQEEQAEQDTVKPESESEPEPEASVQIQSQNNSNPNIRVVSLSKKGQSKEAFQFARKLNKEGTGLSPSAYDHLIRTLLSEGSIEDAMVVLDIAVSWSPSFKLSDIATSLLIVSHCKRGQTQEALENFKSMLSQDRMPSRMSVTRLVQGLGSQGDMAGIQTVERLVKEQGMDINLSNMLFLNNTAVAHIKNGDVEAAVELLEEVLTKPDGLDASIAFVFRKILDDNNEKALDKFSAMAERLANHFASYRPATDLFLVLIDKDKVEDAKFMLARCNAVAEQKQALMSYVAQRAPIPGQIGKIKTLVSLIPNFAEKEEVYSYLMKCHSVDKDLSAAKALYEQMQKEGTATDELSLKRLAKLYREAGEPVPFTEPPESFKFYANKLKEQNEKKRTQED